MRILHVINQLHGGGAEVMVPQIHGVQNELDVESRILALSGSADRDQSDTLSMSSPASPMVFIALYRYIKKAFEAGKGFDVIHSHLTHSQLWVGIVVSIFFPSIKLVTTEHDTSNRRRASAWGRLFDRFLYRSYSKIICISGGVKESMAKWQPHLVSRLEVISNGIDLEKFKASDRLEKEPVTILSVGRLVKKKNFDTAIKAIKALGSISVRYIIIGEGEERENLMEWVRDNRLDDKIEILGHKENVSEYLSDADIFLLPSRWEGFGLSLVEAMATGLPSIVSDVPGISEVLGEDGVCGFKIPPEDEGEMAMQLKALIENPALREKMGADAVLRSKAFCIRKTAKAYCELYKGL